MIGMISASARVVGGEPVAAPVALPPGVTFRRSRIIPRIAGRLAGMGAPAAAVTLGRTVLFAPGVRPTVRLVRHELAHVAQWERYPFTFPFRYIAGHIRHGYGDNPFEAEARAAENGPIEAGERSR